MAAKKKILLVSATSGKNFELARELKKLIDNTTAVYTPVHSTVASHSFWVRIMNPLSILLGQGQNKL